MSQLHLEPSSMQHYLENICTEEDIQVQVELVDFEQALSKLIPSVNQEELDRYLSLRDAL